MSSRQYTVTVKLKGDDTLKKLEQLGSGSPGMRGPRGLPGAPSNNIFGKLQELGVGQLAKLTVMGGSLATIAAHTVESSAQLQGVFKLWETGMTLVFKPLGDFIGLALRPVTVLLLSQLIIPFYKSVCPFFRDNGTKIGQAFAKGESLANVLLGTDLPSTADDDAFAEVNKAAALFGTNLTGALLAIPANIAKAFTDFGISLWNGLVAIPATISRLFMDLGQNIWNYLIGIPALIGGLFTSFGQNLWNGIVGVPSMILDVFTGLATNLASTLANVPKMIYDAIMSIIKSATSGPGITIPSTSRTVGGTPLDTRLNTRAQAIADTVGS